MTGFDWGALLRAAIARGLSPAAFWALTPAEFALLTGRTGGPAPLTQDGLAALEAAFPDKPKGTSDGGS